MRLKFVKQIRSQIPNYGPVRLPDLEAADDVRVEVVTLAVMQAGQPTGPGRARPPGCAQCRVRIGGRVSYGTKPCAAPA